MRKKLKLFRVARGFTQSEMAEKIGCSRSTYAAIENGEREGRLTLWKRLQTAFDVPDIQLMELMKNE